MTIANYDVKNIIIDNESLADILFYDIFSQMQLTIDRLRHVNTPLVGFFGDSVKVEGEITLSITTGQYP